MIDRHDASPGSPAARVLVVDDDPAIRELLHDYLAIHAFAVELAADGDELRAALARGGIDIILLDLSLPGDDGLSLIREIRRSSDIGIIVITGRGDRVDRVVGLELGADDYVSKPFDDRELVARIRSVLRRVRARGEARATPVGGRRRALRFEGWELDLWSRTLTAPRGEPIALTTLEFDMLSALARNPNRAMSRAELLAECTGRDWNPNDRAVDTLVMKLRRKLEPDPGHPHMIKTVRGRGYQFTPLVEPVPAEE